MSNTKEGYIVKPKSNEFLLTSGCCYYDEAVCISDSPFILSSTTGDMKWSSTVKSDDFIKVRLATKKQMKIAYSRLG